MKKNKLELKQELISTYKRYGFNLAKDLSEIGILVFTLKYGYFDNAEIVKLEESAETQNTLNDFSQAGFACKIRSPLSAQQMDEELFNAFFSVPSTRIRLLSEYEIFTSNLVKHYGSESSYEYIKGPYQVNGKEGETTPPQEVLDRIDDDNPILFLIEAAAGFGKTCTAQEIVRLLTENSNRLPLYAELSRNRQAKIFRYILLDEIDRNFPLVNSSLVQSEIKNGRIAAILDGFDELLRKGEDARNFENREPMLETISELLTGRAKVIITTRRTVFFDGDEFHQWLDQHEDRFSVVRIRIQEPQISDWLPENRLKELQAVGLDLDAMANPVLLSYLKCISDNKFTETLRIPEKVVQSYFEYMLTREKDRQDLRMSNDDQSSILKSIAKDMMQRGYTAAQREYIVKFLLESEKIIIENAKRNYSSEERTTREEISNKLASHALLDRSSVDSGKIGFVNEFCLGNYVAETIISDPDWMGDDPRFIDPAVRSYAPRTETSRNELYEGLQASIPYLETGARIEVSAQLKKILPKELSNASAEGLELIGLEFGKSLIRSFQFSETIFRKCIFHKGGLDEVTFVNCRFFDCEIVDGLPAGNIHVLGGHSSPEISNKLGAIFNPKNLEGQINERELILKKSILKRFWPAGDPFTQRPSRPVYKPMKFLCQPFGEYNLPEIYRCIEDLLHQNILIEMTRSNLITLNLEDYSSASEILGA